MVPSPQHILLAIRAIRGWNMPVTTAAISEELFDTRFRSEREVASKLKPGGRGHGRINVKEND